MFPAAHLLPDRIKSFEPLSLSISAFILLAVNSIELGCAMELIELLCRVQE